MSMFEYINKMLEELSSDMEGTLKTPAANHLFMTYENCDILDEAKAQLFRHLMAKLLYLCRRTRHDIQKAIAFLCTRLNKLDKDEFKKLTRVMQYLCRTKNMKLTIDANEHPNWWVDSLYAINLDTRSHSGVYKTLGKGAKYSGSYKQNLNTKSSTEEDLS